MYELTLRFFDLDVRLQSDSEDFIRLFGQMYHRFQIADEDRGDRELVEFTVLIDPENEWGRPVMVLGGEAWPLDDMRLLDGYVYDGVLKNILARVRSHFLLHAGVVAHQGRGIILAADAHHGKTTLTLELVRRGFAFLSDEMAALGRADRWVYPFPRSLRIRPKTLELAGFPEAIAGAPVWLDKLLLDIDEIKPDCLGQAVPLDRIIILRDPEAVEQPPDSDQELRVRVSRLEDSLLAAVSQIEGISEVETYLERGYPALRLRTAHRMAILAQIEALCRQHKILILHISKRTETRPTFTRPARLEPISKRQMVIELLYRFQGGHNSALLREELGGSSTRLFLELAGLIEQAECYQLFVGPLDDMADLVEGLNYATHHQT